MCCVEVYRMADLDLESSVKENGTIRAAVVAVGNISSTTFDQFAGLMRGFTTLDLFGLTHGKMKGCLHFRFVGEDRSLSDWDELMSHRRVRAVIGICHCPSENDLQAPYTSFIARCREKFPHSTQVRCLAFEAPETGIPEDELPDGCEQQLVVVPPKRSADDLQMCSLHLCGPYVDAMGRQVGGSKQIRWPPEAAGTRCG